MRFLGEDPFDWDAVIFPFEFRFEREPDEETGAQIAELWIKHCKRGVIARNGWTFTGCFGYVHTSPQKGDHPAFFKAMGRFARDLHKNVAPLVEVINLSAFGDIVTLDPGPAVPGSMRPVDPSLPPRGHHPGFDRIFGALLAQEQQQRLERTIAAPKDNHFGLELSHKDALGETVYSDVHQELYDDSDDRYFTGPAARPIRSSRYRAYHKTLPVRVGGELTEISLPEKCQTTQRSTPSPDGSAIAFSFRNHTHETAALLNTSDGSLRELLQIDHEKFGEISVIHWLHGGHLGVQTERRLFVIHPESREVLAERAFAGSRHSFFEGRVIRKFPVHLLTWNGKKLRAASNIKIARAFLVAQIGLRALFREGEPRRVSESDLYFELTNVNQVLDKL